MSWKEFIKDEMTYRKPKNGWPETTPNYVGVANEEVKFPCLKEEDKTYFNYAMQETCKFVKGVVLLVAKYKGQYFFGCNTYYGDFSCHGAIKIDVDADLVKTFRGNPPVHAYHVNPHIAVTKPKEEIVEFARNFLLEKIRNYENLRDYADGAVKLFSEAI